MDKTYLFSEGAYSDYNVCFIIQSAYETDKSTLRGYWLEAIKRKTEYVDDVLERVATYLGVEKQRDVLDYYELIDREKVEIAFKKAGYSYKSECEFFEEILIEHGFKILDYEEYNVDDF